MYSPDTADDFVTQATRTVGKPWYFDQVEAANKWDRGEVPHLAKMGVALNHVFDAVRKCLLNTYYLLDGQLGVHHQMGIRNDGDVAIYNKHDFMELKPE